MSKNMIGPAGRAGEAMRLVGFTPVFSRPTGLRASRAVWQDPADGREYVFDYSGQFGCEEWHGWVIDTRWDERDGVAGQQ